MRGASHEEVREPLAGQGHGRRGNGLAQGHYSLTTSKLVTAERAPLLSASCEQSICGHHTGISLILTRGHEEVAMIDPNLKIN